MKLRRIRGAAFARGGISKLRFTLACIVLMSTAISPWALAGNAGRVVVLRTGEDGEATDAFVEQLTSQLAPLEVEVDAETVEALPTDNDSWVVLADAFAKKKAGTLALIRWTCDQQNCILLFLDPQTGGRLVFPIEIDEEVDAVDASAATAREILVGELVPLLSELEQFAAKPELDPARVSPERFFAADRGQFDLSVAQPEKMLWLEGGYQGEAYHPGGDISNGAWLGLVFGPSRILRGALSVGWSGFRTGNAELTEDTVDIQRAYAMVGLRVAFEVGTVELSIAPIARFDLSFASFDTAGGTNENDTRFEMHAGGLTQWKMPLPWNLDALFGVGILATVVGDDYNTESGVEVAERSSLILFWQAGVAYSLF